jgi:Trm5-related predicted tRNA methylase
MDRAVVIDADKMSEIATEAYREAQVAVFGGVLDRRPW